MPDSYEDFRTATLSPLVSVTPSYTAGDCLGVAAPYTLSGILRGLQAGGEGGSIYLHAIRIYDKAKKDIPIDVVIYNANPSATTFTDNTAQTINDADLVRQIAVVPVVTYHDYADNSIGKADNLGIAIAVAASRDLYVSLVARGTGAYAASGDLSVYLVFV